MSICHVFSLSCQPGPHVVSGGVLSSPGIGLCVQPLYLGEIAPTALRGSISIGTVVFLTVGILTGQVLGLK